MNAPIARLFVRRRRALRGARRLHARAGPCSTPKALRDNPHNRRELLEEQQIKRGLDPRRRRHACSPRIACAQPDGSYVRRYPTGQAVRATPVGYSLRRARAAPGSSATTTTSSVGRRRRARLARRPLSGHRAGGRRPVRRSTRPPSASRSQQLGGAQGRRRRARPAHRRGQGDGLVPATTRTRSTTAALRGAQPRPRRAAAQPRHAGPLPAGLDVQGRDRDRRDRHRPVHAGLDRQRATTAKIISGVPLQQRRRRGLRRHHAHRRADALGQHGLRRGRREARQGDDGRRTWTASASAAKPPIDLPARRAARPAASGCNGRIVLADRRALVDVGRMAIGQDKLRSRRCRWRWSPRRSANGGMLMKPHLGRQDRRPRRAHGRRRIGAAGVSSR